MEPGEAWRRGCPARPLRETVRHRGNPLFGPCGTARTPPKVLCPGGARCRRRLGRGARMAREAPEPPRQTVWPGMRPSPRPASPGGLPATPVIRGWRGCPASLTRDCHAPFAVPFVACSAYRLARVINAAPRRRGRKCCVGLDPGASPGQARVAPFRPAGRPAGSCPAERG